MMVKQLTFWLSCLFLGTTILAAALALPASGVCAIPGTGNWSLSANNQDCTLTADNGVEVGNATIDNHALILTDNADFAWNPGYSLTIQNGGSIVIGEGSALKEAYAWMQDADGDGYPAPGMEVGLAAPDLHWYPRGDLEAATDCDDGEDAIWQGMANIYVDQDHDGYTIGSSLADCAGAAAVINGRDYYDADPGVFTSCILGNRYYLPAAERLGADPDDCDPLRTGEGETG
jgi:hypothetical protein